MSTGIDRVGRDPDQPSLGREIVRAAATGARPMIDEVVGAVSGIVLVVVFISLGLVALIVSAVVFVVVMAILGDPTGTLATVVRLVWWTATLGVLFVLFRRVYRRLARRVPFLAVEAGDREVDAAAATVAYLDRERPNGSSLPTPTLAELDARLAPKEPPR